MEPMGRFKNLGSKACGGTSRCDVLGFKLRGVGGRLSVALGGFRV